MIPDAAAQWPILGESRCRQVRLHTLLGILEPRVLLSNRYADLQTQRYMWTSGRCLHIYMRAERTVYTKPIGSSALTTLPTYL